MAAESDKVVVELVASVDKFNADVKSSASGFQQSMGTIEKSATSAERAHKGFTASVGSSRAGMLEFQHVIRGSVDQFAAGAPLTQIFAQHVASVGQAASLSSGAMGKFGAVLAGPWGVAATAAIAIIATLIGKHKEEGDTVESLLAKLREHADKTHLSEEADRLWAQTLDGLIERQEKLNETMAKRLEVQPLVDQANLQQEQTNLAAKTAELAEERKRLDVLRKQLASTPATNVGIGQGGGPGLSLDKATSANPRAAELSRQITESERKVKGLQRVVTDLQKGITQSQILVGQSQGAALADLAAKAQLFSQTYEGAITAVIQENPKLAASATQIEAAATGFENATHDAAGAGVRFEDATHKAVDLARGLKDGSTSAKTYATEISKLTTQLNAMTDAAKRAGKVDPVSQFKQSVFGAEGTGQNPKSSAAGFGQFISSTFETYFKRLYPTQAAALSNAEIDKLRSRREIASAVLDAATDDYVKVLNSAGQKVTAASLYTVHVLGEGGAKKLFAASDSASARSVVGNRVADVNGNIFTGTVAQAKAELARRIGDSSAAVSQGAAALVQLQQQEAERARQFANEKASLDGQVLDARKALGLSAQETADIETAAVKLSHDRYQQNLDALRAEGKLHDDEYATLKQGNDDLEKFRLEMVRVRQIQTAFAERQAAGDNAAGLETGLLKAQGDALRSQEQLATTSAQRRAIADRLIDLQLAEEQIMLKQRIADDELLIAKAAATKNEQDIANALKAQADLAVARAELANAPEKAADAHAANQQQNANPLQSYFNSIPDTADQINEALNGIAADGLANFVDGIANAVAHFQSLGDVGRAVLQSVTAALVKLALQEIIAHTVGRAASAASSAASVAQATAMGAAISAAMAGPAALVSLATSGANSIGAQAGIASTVGLATILGAPKAVGGRIFGPGGDTSDRILTPSSRDEYMIKAPSARAIGYDALDHMNRTGTLPAFAGPSNAVASGAGGSFQGGATSEDIRALGAIVRDSQATISLIASLDPADALQKALGTPAGHRAVLAHFSANSGAINATLRRPG